MKTKKLLILTIIISILTIFCTREILSNTYEINQHNINTSGNVVYISPDGYSEAVFDMNGEIVLDDVNMGSYNFKHPHDEPFGHFSHDTLPWLMWGNSENDKSSSSDRLLAFGKDFLNGIVDSIIINALFIIITTIIVIIIFVRKRKKHKIVLEKMDK